LVATVKVEVAEFGLVTVTGLGLNVPVLVVGKPVTDMLTFPLNEFRGVMVNGNLALVPTLMVSTLVFAAMEKSGATTTNATEVV
jgi:hypothetical protein